MRMKRTVLLLAAALMLAAAACGASRPAETAPAAAEMPPECRINDRIETDCAAFTLTGFQLTNAISLEKTADSYLTPFRDGEAARYPGDYKTAADGEVFACIEYTCQNIGSTILRRAGRDLPTGGSISGISNTGCFLEVAYDGRRQFLGADCYEDGIRLSGGFRAAAGAPCPTDRTTDVQMPEQRGRCCLALPSEVAENTDAPLKLIVYLPSERGALPFTYAIR